MPPIGQMISHYRIVAKIGQGGMGEVYLADDVTLERKVALKFLPEAFTSNPERMASFEREAKFLASLNHPNIAGIHGLEQAGGNRFLVLEYVEGETLQARLSKGAMPFEKALELCRQIAEGLEAAHKKGVIHRDLKPANVMITAEENVKILDFCLAKAYAGEQEQVNLSNSPTLSVAATQQGVILGTAAYMSPEQAKGKAVDKRAEIWAFGAVLFEMLTEKPAFPGEDISEILASVIKGDVNLGLLSPNIHPRLREVLIRCLQKDQKKRYRDIGEAQYEIDQVLADPGGALAQPVATTKAGSGVRQISPWIAATLIVTAIVAGVVIWNLRTPAATDVIRFYCDLPEGRQFNASSQFNPVLAVSPDGKRFVFNTDKGLYLRSIDEPEAKPIAGTADETIINPMFSPDGKRFLVIKPAAAASGDSATAAPRRINVALN
jgi:serine/threonine protein kinase